MPEKSTVTIKDFVELKCSLIEDVTKEANMDCVVHSHDEHDGKVLADVYAVDGNIGVLYNLWWATHPPEPTPPPKTCSIIVRVQPFREKKDVEMTVVRGHLGDEITLVSKPK